MKKAVKIILISFLFVYLLIGLIINPWCITKSMTNFGMKEIGAYDVQNAWIRDDKVLLLEADTLVRTGRERIWHQSSATIKMRCDLSDSLDSFLENVTDEVKKHQYRNIPGRLDRQLHPIAETERIFYARYSQCNLEEDDLTLPKRKLQLVTDDLLEKMDVPRDTFLYIAGSFKYRPTGKYLIIYNEQNTIIVPVTFGDPLRHETWVRHFRYALYPFTIALDIVTCPIQICQMLFGESVYNIRCPEWTCGP